MPSTRALPFAARQALLLPSATSSSPATSLDSLSLAVSDPSGSVSLVGAAASTGGNIAPSRLPTASQGTTRLFDEIFGADDLAATAAAAKGKGKSRAVELLTSSAAGATALDGTVGSVLLETPAHTLPPVRLLWRELMCVPAPAEGGETTVGEAGGEGDVTGGAGAGRTDVDATGVKVKAPQVETAGTFASLPAGTMAGIFGARLGIVGSA